METVKSFKYLGYLLTATDNEWSEVIVNLQKTHSIWYHIYRILGREAANTKKSGRFYLAVVHTILIFGLETWVVTPRMGRILVIFHHSVEIRLLGMQPLRRTDGI